MKMNVPLMLLSWEMKNFYSIMKEKDAIYMKEDFSDEDGVRAAELEGEFAELGGWEAESEASQLLQKSKHSRRIALPKYETNWLTVRK